MNVKLRPVGAEPQPEFFSMYHDYLGDLSRYAPPGELDHISDRQIRDMFFSVEAKKDRLIPYYIDFGNNCCGFVIVQHLDWQVWRPTLYLVEFYIKPEYRLRGIGLEAAEKALRSGEEDRVLLYVIHGNAPAEAFWTKVFRHLDMVPADASDVADNDADWCATLVYEPKKKFPKIS